MSDGAAAEPWVLPPVESVGCIGHARLCTTVGVQVQSVLRGCALGERVSWDVALQLVPTPQGPRPMVMIYLTMPSAVLGELCGEVVLLEPQHLSDANVERNVRGAVERVREARSASAHPTASRA
jgi:hypothetical protein